MKNKTNNKINNFLKNKSLRYKGGIKCILGLIASVITLFIAYKANTQGYKFNMFTAAAVSTPIILLLIGLLEIIINRPLSDIETWWNNLKGWQRGIFGLLVVIMAFIVAVFGMILVSSIMY